MTHPLRALLDQAARGRFPQPDWSVELLPSPPGPADAVVDFTAHHVVACGLHPEEVQGALASVAPDSTPMDARFLTWLGGRLGSRAGSLDVVLAALGPPEEPTLELAPADLHQHKRVERATRYRHPVEAYTDPERQGIVVLGRGLALRQEASIEVAPDQRGTGLGRRLALAARVLADPAEPLFAQVAPGNAASLRAFLAAGYRPLGAEVLFLR